MNDHDTLYLSDVDARSANILWRSFSTVVIDLKAHNLSRKSARS